MRPRPLFIRQQEIGESWQPGRFAVAVVPRLIVFTRHTSVFILPDMCPGSLLSDFPYRPASIPLDRETRTPPVSARRRLLNANPGPFPL